MSFLTFPVSGDYQPLTPGSNVQGTVMFIPNLIPGGIAHGSTGGQSIGVVSAPVTASIVNGILTANSSFATVVTLYSNDSQFNLADTLQYTVNFLNVTVDGRPVAIDSFTFDAPSDSTAVDLVAAAPGGPLQIVAGLPTIRSTGISDSTDIGRSLLTAATTLAVRTILDISGDADTATLQNKTLDDTNTATLKDSQFTVVDDTDPSKAVRLQLAGLSTSTTRTLTVPDANTTIVGTDAAQALSNKDMTSGTNTFPILNQSTTGNAATATALQTSRFINGTAFNGTANITINLDAIGPLAADYSINNHRLTNLADPVSAQDAATKSYVDATLQGLDVKNSVNAATVGTETFTIASGTVTQIAGTTLDGVAPKVNDRILIKDAPAATGTGSVNSTQPGNGIYVVTGNTTNLTVSRATDQSGAISPLGNFAFVDAGTANGGGGYVVTVPSTSGTFTYGTGTIKWTQFSGAGAIVNGTGLSKSGNVISLTTPVAVGNGGTGAAAISGLVKGNGASAFTAATAGTDYAPATTGTSILKANGSGAFGNAVAGTDYAPATTGTSALAGNGSGGFTTATFSSLGTPTAACSFGGFAITSLANPTNAQDAATKNYVDSTLSGHTFVSNSATTATGAGTTTLTATSAPFQQFTGALTQVVVLPQATTLTSGQSYTIANRSTGAVTVQLYGGAALQVVAGNSEAVFTLISNSSSAGTWDIQYATGATTGPYDLSIMGCGAATARAANSYGDNPFGIALQRACTLTSVTFRCLTADASGNLVVELTRNGTVITGTSTTIAYPAQTTGATTTFSQACNAGDIIALYVTGVGTTPGLGLVADIKGSA